MPPTPVHAVIPCFNRPDDVRRLLAALPDQLDPSIELAVTTVDNASDPPLTATFTPPPGLDARVLRLDRNVGGAGGFNAGLAHALDRDPRLGSMGPQAGFLWLLDSDALPRPGALATLVRTLRERPDALAVGSAVADPGTGRVLELGGHVDRRTGALRPALRGAAGAPALVQCDYVAACSALVRGWVVRRFGLLPDVFLNADDAEWFIRLSRLTGLRVLAARDSIVEHPRFDRSPTWQRYYQTRNARGPIDALELPRRVLRRRALADAARAVAFAIDRRDDLARLHLRGLGDALARARGTPNPREPAGPADLPVNRTAPPPFARWGGRRPGAVTLAKLAIASGADVLTVAHVGGSAMIAALRLGCTRAQRTPLPTAGAGSTPVALEPRLAGTGVVVLSYNRSAAVLTTLAHLTADTGIPPQNILVVDNASTDATPAAVTERHPLVPVLALDHNAGVEAFNIGVEHAASLFVRRDAPLDHILILDDDARPEPEALAAAAALLDSRPELDAVALAPRHPRDGAWEWPLARAMLAAGAEWRGGVVTDAWPAMGCANLVRLSAWRRAGGYEAAYFLYRNDTDLALKLLAGKSLTARADSEGAADEPRRAAPPVSGIHMNPAWVAWHDSPAAARKSVRWHRLATRNWIWTARRHARGQDRLRGIALGWLWAHKLAGLSLPRHWATLRGAIESLTAPAPGLPAGVVPDGRAYGLLLASQLAARAGSVVPLRTGATLVP